MPNGKGSGRRPAVVPDARVASEWERIFGTGGYLVDPDLPAVISNFGPLPLQRPALPPSFAGPIPDAALRRKIRDVASGAKEQ